MTVHRDGDTERIRLDNATQVLDALTGRFGINLADLDGIDIEARVNEVLDT